MRFCSRRPFVALLLALCCCLPSASLFATETENLGISVLPAPGAVKIDGKFDDWDLTGGILACGDVEHQREKMGVWIHAMYDSKNVYILARWLDQTPLNNPGQVIGSYGFAGDCLQWRYITNQGTPQERGGHFTCWQDSDGKDAIFFERGVKFDEGTVKDSKADGAQQAFLKTGDSSYTQEIAMPWSQLTRDGQPLAAGSRMILTFEPNFTVGLDGRYSIKDVFQPGVSPDRVFTFMSYPSWGPATLEKHGKISSKPVRLADGREFATKLEKGLQVVDWTGLIKSAELTGFKPIEFSLPEDGYVSIQILNSDGVVVRQLVNAGFYAKGNHTVKWDGLTTPNWKKPGDPVSPGQYTWRGIRHTGLGLKLVGWAHNSGNAPWDSSPTSNWGGDHGLPCAADAVGETVILGWGGAEAGKALLAVDLKGNVIWKTSRHGMSGAQLVAADEGTVFVQNWNGQVFRTNAKTGNLSSFEGTDSADIYFKNLWGDKKDMPQDSADAMKASNGKLYLGFTKQNLLAVLNAKTGKLEKTLDITGPVDIETDPKGKLLVLTADKLLAIDPNNNSSQPIVGDLKNASGLAIGADGTLYVGVRDPDNQVHVYDAAGKKLRSIGRSHGRSLVGKWQSDGMRFIHGMTVDSKNQLWVMEDDGFPKRVSVWNTQTGELIRELFGPTTYGALGGNICPRDPYRVVGAGCEWKIDPATGQASCVSVITRTGMENSRFGTAEGRTYLATAGSWAFSPSPLYLFERVTDIDYRLRSRLYYADLSGKEIDAGLPGTDVKNVQTVFWADNNGDGVEQPDEVVSKRPGIERWSGWYMNMTPGMTFYSPAGQFKVTGFTACGAPKYDLANPAKTPAPGLGSPDDKLLLTNGNYGDAMTWMDGFDLSSGKKLWSYADNFNGVHGSHHAIPPQVGMVRGSFGPCGVAKLPAPIGQVWIIATNVGEWHMINEQGMYISRLFQGDPLKVEWPAKATPGTSIDNVPCGMGGEDFGGSVCVADNGKLYLQTGKTGFWDVEVTGLETAKTLPGGKLDINGADVKLAGDFQIKQLQAATGKQKLVIAKKTVELTGDFNKDFAGAQVIQFKKQDSAAVKAAAAVDGQRLYLGWEVTDDTPWINSATDVSQMYIGGDTVDFQLATNANAPTDRAEAAAGDLRLSIGNFQGEPKAVVYRPVSSVKKPRTFSSGIVKEFVVDDVEVLSDVQIKVNVRPKQGYIVEVSIPLSSLGETSKETLRVVDGAEWRGDFGATHGGPDGQRTRLRTYWNNQATGIVDDAVFELKLEPHNWGDITFQP